MNRVKIVGLLTLSALIVLMMAGCDNPSDGGEKGSKGLSFPDNLRVTTTTTDSISLRGNRFPGQQDTIYTEA